MSGPLRVVGVLDEGLGGIRHALDPELDVRVAPTPLAAAALMATARPDVVVIDNSRAWQREVVRRLRPDRRPGVVAVGPIPWPDADEWIDADRIAVEAEARVQLAYERGRSRRAAARKALIDPLTSLPNRRAVILELAAEARRASRRGGAVSLVMIDLDSFKQVNDRRGHAAGDAVLRRVGAALRQATRGNEVCGRIGGDEFAVVVAGDEEQSQEVAHRLQAALAEAGIAASVGWATWSPTQRLRDLYHRADASLRDNKNRRHAMTHDARDAAPRVAGAWSLPPLRMPDPTTFPHHSQEAGNDLGMH